MRTLPLLLLLFIPILNLSAQPLQLQAPEWIEGGYRELELIIGVPFNGSVHVRAVLLRELIEVYEVSEETSEGHLKLGIQFPHEPGGYELEISLRGAVNLSELVRIYVAPSLRDIADLSYELFEFEREYSRVKGFLGDNAPYFEERRRALYEKFGDLTGLVVERRDPEGAASLFTDISNSLEEISGELLEVSGYEAFIWSSLVPLDSSLRLPPEIGEFWMKLFSTIPRSYWR